MVQLAQKPSNHLNFCWEDLLSLLRDELQEYGGLIGLLSSQQQSILNRRPESLLAINQSVQTQMEASQMLQRRRQGVRLFLGGGLRTIKFLHAFRIGFSFPRSYATYVHQYYRRDQ